MIAKFAVALAGTRSMLVLEANSAVGLLVPHFKKTAPFEQGFNGRRQATPKTRPLILSGLGECKAFVRKGTKRFSVRKQATRRELAKATWHYGELTHPLTLARLD